MSGKRKSSKTKRKKKLQIKNKKIIEEEISDSENEDIYEKETKTNIGINNIKQTELTNKKNISSILNRIDYLD